MKSKKIYLIRHGETDYNKRGVVQGSGINAPLNETGRKQAAAFYQKYKNIPFDKIYTSELQRSIQSVQSFIDDGIPQVSFAGLNEINWGIYEGKIVNSHDSQYYDTIIETWTKGNIDVRIEGGDSPLMVQERQQPVLDYIVKQQDEETILICMHGRAMRIFLCLLVGENLKNMDQFAHTNLCLYLLNYEDYVFTIELANDQTHLALLKV